jgi:hypothetical protein
VPWCAISTLPCMPFPSFLTIFPCRCGNGLALTGSRVKPACKTRGWATSLPACWSRACCKTRTLLYDEVFTAGRALSMPVSRFSSCQVRSAMRASMIQLSSPRDSSDPIYKRLIANFLASGSPAEIEAYFVSYRTLTPPPTAVMVLTALVKHINPRNL